MQSASDGPAVSAQLLSFLVDFDARAAATASLNVMITTHKFIACGHAAALDVVNLPSASLPISCGWPLRGQRLPKGRPQHQELSDWGQESGLKLVWSVNVAIVRSGLAYGTPHSHEWKATDVAPVSSLIIFAR